MHAFIAGAWVLLVGGWALWVRAWLWRIELSRQLSSVLPDGFRWLPEGFRAEVRAVGTIGVDGREWVLCWRVGWLGVRTYVIPLSGSKTRKNWREISVTLEDQLKPSVLGMALQAQVKSDGPR